MAGPGQSLPLSDIPTSLYQGDAVTGAGIIQTPPHPEISTLVTPDSNLPRI